MTRSKLEKYLSVLETLVARPLEFDIILYQVDDNWEAVKKHLDFLISHDLVERLPLGKKRVVYTITEKGLTVLDALHGQEDLEKYSQIMLVYEE
jgi:predicted transcriptional regulator